jgi:tetrahydromethanopterin S-methyltransferase subunit D
MPSWKMRRRAVFSSLVFGFALLVYVAVRWEDLRIAEVLAVGAFTMIATVVSAYIAGATVEDIKLWRQGDLDDVPL